MRAPSLPPAPARSLALALAVALAGAGCVASEEDALVPGDPNATRVAQAEAAVDDGAAPMPTDVGHMPHMHDYWAGRERVTLFDDAIDLAASDDPFAPLYGLPSGYVGGQTWRLPDGAIVYEGTGQMEITATWDDPLVTSLAVAYRSGAAPEFSDPLPLAQGKALVLPVTPEMTDVPHMTTSRWSFLWQPAESPGAAMGVVHVRIELVRLADIMLFPGHPEHFQGLPEKTLHDKEHEHTEVSYVKRVPNFVTQGEFGEKTVVPDEIVPMETLAMRVELSVLDASALPGEVTDIRFFYHGADTTFLGHPFVIPLEGSFDEGFLVYQFPVTPEQTDSPYADESQWLFFVEPVTKFLGLDEEPDCGGCADVSIQYHLKIVAYDHELAEYSEMEDVG